MTENAIIEPLRRGPGLAAPDLFIELPQEIHATCSSRGGAGAQERAGRKPARGNWRSFFTTTTNGRPSGNFRSIGSV